MSNNEALLFYNRGGPFGRAFADAAFASDAAYQACESVKLRAIARALNDFEGRMWNRGDDTGKVVALTIQLVMTLRLTSSALHADQIAAAPDKFMKALDTAAIDCEEYQRQHNQALLKAYQALYSDIYERCDDTGARAASAAVIRASAVGGRARNHDDALRTNINAVNRQSHLCDREPSIHERHTKSLCFFRTCARTKICALQPCAVSCGGRCNNSGPVWRPEFVKGGQPPERGFFASAHQVPSTVGPDGGALAHAGFL